MRKQYYFLVTLILLTPVFSLANITANKTNNKVPRSLRFLATQKAFDFKTNRSQRERLKKQLEDPSFRIGAFDFDGMVLEYLDLSGFNLSGMDFSGCTFNCVDLSYADLTDVRLRRAVFNYVNLTGADLRITLSNTNYLTFCKFNRVTFDNTLLYGNEEKDFLYIKDRIHSFDSYKLVYQYSELMKRLKSAKKLNKIIEVEVLKKHTQCFHNLLALIELNLTNKNLTNFDLTGLDFQNVKLKDAILKNVSLSENFQIPDYRPWDSNPLFDKWLTGTNEEKSLCQKILNSGVNLFTGIDVDRLHIMDWSSKDLKNANFSGIDLSGCNLSNLNLEYACFEGTVLEDTRFRGSNLQGALFTYNLMRADLSYTNLRNANMYSADLTDANLIGACLENVNLKEATISGVKLLINFTLPVPCEDIELANFYNFDSNNEVKGIVKQVLKCRGIYYDN